MKIRNKLFIVHFVVFIPFLLTVGIFVASGYRLINLKELELEASRLKNLMLELEYSTHAILYSKNMPISRLEYSFTTIDAALKKFRNNKNHEDLIEDTHSWLKSINELYGVLTNRDLVIFLSSNLSEYRSRLKEQSLAELYEEEKSLQTDSKKLENLKKIKERVEKFIMLSPPLFRYSLSLYNDVQKQVLVAVKKIQIQSGTAAFVFITLSLLMVFFTFRRLSTRLSRVEKGIQKIIDGDLTIRIEVHSRDELSSIPEAFNMLADTVWQQVSTMGNIIQELGASFLDGNEGKKSTLEQTILNFAIESTQADSGAFYAVEHSRNSLRCIQHSKSYALPFDGNISDPVAYGQSVIGLAALSKNPMFIQRIEGQNIIPQRNIFDKNYISSCIILPLVAENNTVGLLCLEKNSEKNFFSDLAYAKIFSFVEFAAITMSNLFKYNELLEESGMNREMEIASMIQKSLLPPRTPRVKGFDISVKTWSLKGISGDIYDFFPLSRNRSFLCMAKVKEKGIASSMLLVILKTLVRVLATPDVEPAAMMKMIRTRFTETTGMESSLNISLLLLDSEKEQFSYCGTGEQQILLFDTRSSSIKRLNSEKKGEGHYANLSGFLRKDFYLMLMTDGFLNAENEHGESYGWSRVENILYKHDNQTADWLTQSINEDLEYFERNCGQRDDRSIFIAKYTGKKS